MRTDAMDIGAACAWAIFTPLLGTGVILAVTTGSVWLFPIFILLVVIYGVPIAAVHVFLVWLPAWFLLGAGSKSRRRLPLRSASPAEPSRSRSSPRPETGSAAWHSPQASSARAASSAESRSGSGSTGQRADAVRRRAPK